MTGRIAGISLSVILLPLTVLAQSAPPEVEEALRSRVTEFLQYHVDGAFRKAYDMVADDTKDYYFGIGKVQLKGFKIDDVKFTDNFTKANVTATMAKTVNVAGQDIPVAMPSTTTWKIENGKWVWYNDLKTAWVTPLGPAAAPPADSATPKSDSNAAVDLPKDFSDKTIAAAARNILQQVGVNKKEVTLATDKPSEETVVFHNGMTGSVQLQLSAPEIPGFTAKIEQLTARAAADIPLVLRYEPGDHATRPDPITVQLSVQPLNQLFLIRVNFAAPALGIKLAHGLHFS